MRTPLLLAPWWILLLAQTASLLGAHGARADVPWPTCADQSCEDPADFGAYLFAPPGVLPDDFDPAARSSWKYVAGSGMDVPGAWRITTGRPDVVVAVLDSGIRWNARSVANKVALNTAELPVPDGCASHDCNGDGFVSIADFEGTPDGNGNGLLDGQDLILAFSDGVDDDGNGYVDDICGWDFADDDNDPDDVVDYGHGTGEAEDSTGEANDGSGLPGVAPSALFLPIRVGDSFVAAGSDFAQGVVYAVDAGADVVQEALGTLHASPSSQAAIDYAYRRGVPVMASAADEQSRHHNLPAALDHTIWLNSIVHGDGTLVEQEEVYDLLNGCTNHGGHAWVAVPSNSCSSEATGRGAGLAALLVSHGRNLVDAGLLSPYPGLDAPFSAEEVRQLFRRSAVDVDHAGALDDLTIDPLINAVLSAPALGLALTSKRFPTQAGWDEFTGFGRADGPRLLDVTAETIPPEADLASSLAWFDTLDPAAGPVAVRGSAAAVRAPGPFSWALEVGCGVQPSTYAALDDGVSAAPLVDAVLGQLDPAGVAADCGFDPATPSNDPDAFTITLRLRVVDALGNEGIDRRTLAIHGDADLRYRLALGSSAESSPVLADVNRDGVLDVVAATSDGRVHVLEGATGESLPGFPARTDPIAVHPSPGYASGEVPVPHEGLIGPLAADDLDGDGRVEIVAASIEGGVYVFDDHGRRRPGFPVATDPANATTARKNKLNDPDRGVTGAPTLVDLDAPGIDPGLEIVVAAWDGHVYAWSHDGALRPGYPVRIADRSKVAIDADGLAQPLVPGVRERGTKLIGSPAVGDLDGDGRPEIVVTSNEEYEDEPGNFAPESPLLQALVALGDQLGESLDFDTAGRMHALHPDGELHPGGPSLPNWPLAVPVLTPGILPTVGTGVPGAPALAPVGPDGALAAAIFAVTGPILMVDADAEPVLGRRAGAPRGLAADFPDGFPLVPATAGSPDAPLFGALGSVAFGDITGDGLPELVAPTAGLRKLLDLLAPAQQQFSDHQVSAFDPATGQLLPAFPRPMDDLQFLSSPALADVTGDGIAEVLAGSGVYLLRAYGADGTTPAGFPRFTHGWVLASPTPGDIDGDGRVEVVATTREGHLYVWDTPGLATEGSIPWQGFGRDRRNTQNLASGVSPLAPPRDELDGLVWSVEALGIDLEERSEAASGEDAKALHKMAVRTRMVVLRIETEAWSRFTKNARGLAAGLAEAGQDDLLRRLASALGDAAHVQADCDAALRRCANVQAFARRGDKRLSRDQPLAAVAPYAEALRAALR